jgi:cytochrome oxidase Cu insertion factor (SCO1/SenC/PrrC family)
VSGDAEPAAGEPTRGLSKVMIVVMVVALVGALTFATLAVRHRRQQLANLATGLSSATQLRASGIPASVPTEMSYLMGLSTVPTKPAPGFTLTDQNGRVVSLASLRGHPVVLEFMDPHCVDICPIVSQEFIDASLDLGKASNVAFLAVNVNVYYRSVADMAAYSREHQLTTLPAWHFVTGSPASLEAVWHGYNIAVMAPNPNADIIHTSVVYFIDPQGRERYIATPMVDYTASGAAYLPAGPMAEWGQGIALVTRSLG